ncbi:bcl-2-like protein 10 [Vicugna pacos]|uniref:Bcl-2-like protein 10 n=1 Tax=Vicugna pacos TaxID=30538 RepID=A0ABM5DBJ0_VICPA
MADGLRERTARLLTGYLQYCVQAPSTPEAAVQRCVAAQIQEDNSHFFSYYRGFRGDRVELVARMAQELLADDQGPSWGRVASLLTFAGTLLERPPPGTWGPREKEDISRNCRLLVASLCVQFSGLHRTWLVAHGGWDGFCLFYQPALQPSWERQLVWVFLSCYQAELASSHGTDTYKDNRPAQVCFSNIFVSKAVAEAIRTSLGPKGMHKMIQDGRDDVTITNGAPIPK